MRNSFIITIPAECALNHFISTIMICTNIKLFHNYNIMNIHDICHFFSTDKILGLILSIGMSLGSPKTHPEIPWEDHGMSSWYITICYMHQQMLPLVWSPPPSATYLCLSSSTHFSLHSFIDATHCSLHTLCPQFKQHCEYSNLSFIHLLFINLCFLSISLLRPISPLQV